LVVGVVFLVCFTLYLFYFLRSAMRERKSSNIEHIGKTGKYIFFIIGGIIGVIIGAWLLVESSVSLARFLGVPEIIIALTMVSVGTSLPELVVSSLAAFRKQSDIAIGNIIGSNIFNILLILGLSLLFIPMNATASLVHLTFLLVISLLMIPLMYTGGKLSRLNGICMLLLYSGYLGYLFFSI
jgi:cation:H+ antiporter